MNNSYLQPYKAFTPQISERKKSAFEIEIEKEIELYLDSLPKEEFQHELLSPKLLREKMKEELLIEQKSDELIGYIKSACEILTNDSKELVLPEVYGNLMDDLSRISRRIDRVRLDSFQESDLHRILAASDESLNTILDLACKKFDQEKFEDSLSLLAMLTVFRPSSYDYWYRLAIAAQYNKNYQLAIRAYSISSLYNPSDVGPHLFAAECRVACQEYSEAKEEYELAKNMIEQNHSLDSWNDLLAQLNVLIKAA